MTLDKPLVITAGEPAGVGPELCLRLAHETLPASCVVVSDPELMRSRAAQIGIDVRITEVNAEAPPAEPSEAGELFVIPTPFPEKPKCGYPAPSNADALLDGLRIAVDGCLDGRFAGLVTAPLQKSVINDAGVEFTGHTELLAELTNAALPVMLLVAGDLRVALASTHIPLREVPGYLTQSGLRKVLQILLEDLQGRFGIAEPEVVVCGLNPHAGEGGHLGTG